MTQNPPTGSRLPGEPEPAATSPALAAPARAASGDRPLPASMPPQRPTRTSAAAVAGLVCGLASIPTAGMTAIPGMILSVIGLRRVQRAGGTVGGEGLAVAGLATSVVGLFVGLLVLALVLAGGAIAQRALIRPGSGGVSYSDAEIMRRSGQSMMGLKSLATAALDYAEEHGGRLPLSDEFPIGLARYIEGRHVPPCPTGRAFAMNAALSGMRLSDIDVPERTVLFFEAAAGGPVVGGTGLLRSLEGEDDGYIVAFADGHVEIVWPDDIEELIWHPGKGPMLVKRGTRNALCAAGRLTCRISLLRCRWGATACSQAALCAAGRLTCRISLRCRSAVHFSIQDSTFSIRHSP